MSEPPRLRWVPRPREAFLAAVAVELAELVMGRVRLVFIACIAGGLVGLWFFTRG